MDDQAAPQVRTPPPAPRATAPPPPRPAAAPIRFSSADCGPAPAWPPADQSTQPPALGPLPTPASWTGGLVGQQLMQDLIVEGYTPHYVTEWAAACNWYVTCYIKQQGSPAISGFAPTQGPPGTAVTISGSDLAATTDVRFNEVFVPSFTAHDTTIATIVPSTATSGHIKITVAGVGVTSDGVFTVTAAAPPPLAASEGDPAGDPGDPPPDDDYNAWELQWQIEFESS